MKEKPILFSTEMVRAILGGRKTQTRRIIKPQPTRPWNMCTACMTSGNYTRSGIHFKFSYDDYKRRPEIAIHPNLPFWEGDRLWVRETFARTGDNFHDDWPGHGDYYYKADDPFSELEPGSPTKGIFKWRPSIFMPREACRIILEVRYVRIERLRDITEEDAMAEGIEEINGGFKNYGKSYPLKEFGWGDKAILSYMSLWESINGKGSWFNDPWVWVIDFKRIQS